MDFTLTSTYRFSDIRICRFLRREKDVALTEASIRREMVQ